MLIAQTLKRYGYHFPFLLCFLLFQTNLSAQCPTIVAIMVDACGTEQSNEFVIINSGGGFMVSDLQIDFDINNNIVGPENNDININANPCGLQAGNPSTIGGCSNIIPVGPGASIPANAFVVLQTSAGASTQYDFSGACATQQCIYVIQSTCARSAGAFSNAGGGTRTTVLSINGGCSSSYTYDRTQLSNANGDYFLPPSSYGNGGCVAPPVSFGNPPTAPVLSGVPASICQLAAPIALPVPQSGINGNWSGTGVSANMFNPAGLSGSITLTYTPAAGQCAIPATTAILVNPPTIPTPNPIGPYCTNDPAVALPTTVSGINGNWSGTGVTANSFNPATAGAGSFTLTFTPTTGQCANNGSLSVQVNPTATPSLGTTTLCQTDPLYNLTQLQDPLFPTGTWSGTGVTGTNFNPSGQSGNITLTFTSSTACVLPTNTTITVNPPVTPVISGVPASICQTAAAIPLPTPQGGFAGNWSGQGVTANSFDPAGLSGSITLTFTPNAGQCASNATTNINVTVPTTPVISGVPASICQTAAAIALPTTQSGFAGNWSGQGVTNNSFDPAGLSGSVTLTFTPNAGQCASNATTNINVTVPTTPVISGVPASICQTSAAIALPTTQSGFAGNWSGQGVTNNSFDPAGLSGSITLTFTPNAGQCASTATTNINVTPPTTPVISGVPASICQTAAAIPLPTPQDGFAGNWSGQGVTNNSFDPAGLSGSITLTFTPNAGQCASNATTNISVTTPTTPVISGVPASICQTSAAIALPTTHSGFAGNWSGQGVTNNSFDPAGLSGSITLTFTPNAGQCASTATTNINVTPPTTPVISGVPASICQSAAAIALPTPQGGFAGNWSGQGVTNNSFDPAGLSGSITLTFTPNAGQCASNATTSISVTVPTTPVISGVPASICQTAAAIPLPTPQGGFAGNWSGQGMTNNSFDPAGLSGSITLTFTPNAGQCASNATTSINVTVPTTPVISGVPASICQTSAAIALPTTHSGFAGNWSGQGVTNNSFDPAGLSGSITLTFTPNAGQCASTATTNINVTPPTTPVVSGVPASICQSAAAIALPTPQGGFAGNWSGQGVTNNSFDPAGLSGSITLTFTPNAGQCASNASTSINVTPPTTPVISGVPASICQTAAAITLPTPQGGFAGNWSGQGVTSNSFDPAGLSGSITLTFTPNAGQCASNATTNISVTVPGTPMLGTATLCQTDGPFTLSNLNDPNFPSGTWSGPGVSGGSFNPAGQNGNVTLTFSPSANCANPATTTVTVNLPATPTLGTASLCQNDVPYPLANLLDPNFPSGTWSGPGVNGGNFNPAGQNGNVTLTFTPSANCTTPATTTVTVSTSPSFTALSAPCDPVTQTYVVIFTITGGTAPYTVNGVGLTGSTFTSNPIPSGMSYSFVIDDANGCGPVTVSGSQNCSCATNAGTMNFDNAPLVLCYNHSQFSVPFNQNQFLDNDDVLQFVVHDNPGATLGNIIATSNTPVIPTPPGLVLGQTYYVSAVAGNNNGSGNVDLGDPCLSVSQGIPVLFYLPTVQIGNDAAVCASDCYDIPLQLTGASPFCLEWSVFYNNTFIGIWTACNLVSGGSVQFCPSDYNITSGVITLQVNIIEDANSCGVTLTSPSINLTISNGVVNNLSPTLCPGEAIVVNGTQYNAANPSGTEVFPSGSFSGCDSIVNVNLAFYPPAVFNFSANICPSQTFTVNGVEYDETNPSGTQLLPNAAANGCDSIINVNLTLLPSPVTYVAQTFCSGGSVTVNGTVYDESYPSGTEVIIGGAANGCDSAIVVNLSFNSVVTSNINPTLCPGGSMTVNGTTYNAANSSGTETMPGGSYLGCDSVAVVSLSFYPPATASLNQVLCTGGSVTVAGTVFDETNPSGTVVIPNGSFHGCDSTVVVSLSFNSVVTTNLNPTLCLGESLTVNGTTYNAANPTGTETMPGSSYLGCDSVAVVSLSFYPPSTANLSQVLCAGTSVTVGSTVFNQANPSGTVVIPNASVNGCDSTVNVSLQFLPTATGSFGGTICAGSSVTVGGTIFNQNNPSGMVTLPNASYLGCDSTVSVSLSFYPLASSTIDDQLCTGGSINVNGTVYNAANPSGMEVIGNGSANGCDSTVIVNLTFGNSVVVTIDPTLCAGEVLVVNGTTYSTSNPTGSVTFANGSYLGCDSTVNISLSFYPPASSTVLAQLCTGGSLTVNGTVYNTANPSGIETILNGSANGCDSTVVVNLTFASSVTTNLNQTLCAGEVLVVNGMTFSASNPTGSVTFPNGSYLGCDSIVNVSLQFFPTAMGNFGGTFCPGSSVTVGGMVFNENTPSGTVILPNASYLGCDSTVNVSLSFYAPASSTILAQLCTGGSITVNGTVYNAANPSGTEVIGNGSMNGCDSTVVVNLTFGNSVVVTIDPTLCAGEVLVINGTTYSASNPVGSVTFPNGSYLGCDSTVNVSLSFFPAAVGNLTEILQSGGFVVVNGTLYDEQNPAGTEVFVGGSYTGCDSTVVVNLLFEGAEVEGIVEVSSPLCHFGNDGAITLTGIQGGTPPFVVALNGGSSAPVVGFPVVFDNLTFGFYTLTIIDALGNITNQEIFLPDAPELQLDMGGTLTVPLGNSVVLSAGTASQIATWAWSPPDYLGCTDCPNPLSTPLNDIVYTLSVTDINGCTAQGKRTVLVEKIEEVFVPNAFSPNNDGINDELTVFAGPQVDKIKSFQVFSRWGELVFVVYNFAPNDLQLGWNGTFNGQQLDPAVFVWFAEVVFLDGSVRLFKGDVSLIK